MKAIDIKKVKFFKCVAFNLVIALLFSACYSKNQKSSYELTSNNDFIIYDEKGRVILRDGPFYKQPQIHEVTENVVLFTLQAGTGFATRWGYFYDLKNNVKSSTFRGIFDYTEKYVAYGASTKVMVSKIFDDDSVQVFDDFSQSFAKVAEPIICVEFLDNGKNQIKITYVSGEDYKEVTEIKAVQ